MNGGDGNDYLDGGTGIDWVEFAGGAAVSVDLVAATATGQGTDTIFNVENILGSSFNDTLKGSAGNNVIWGGDGNDTFIATQGVDTLVGDTGVDVITFAQLGAAAFVNLATGTYSSTLASGTLASIENVIGSSVADNITGDAADNVLTGGLGNDILNGGAGSDTLSLVGNAGAGATVNLTTGTTSGSDGNDTLTSIENVNGSAFNDRITGSAGNNILSGNAGNDSFFITQGIDTIDGGAGTHDALYFNGSLGVTANIAAGTYSLDANNFGTAVGIEDLVGSAGGDSFTGNAGNNVLDGNAGNDVIAGGGGNDQIWGGAGSDTLIADGGDDTLVGNYAYIAGYGDAASDTFVIKQGAHNVVVSDFKIGVDKLDFSDFNLGNSSYWTAHAEQSSPAITTMTLTGQAQEVVTITLNGVSAGSTMSPNDMIGGSIDLIAAPWVNPNGNGFADIFTIMPQASGLQVIDSFEDGRDRLDLTFLNAPGWDGSQGGAVDGSTLFQFWNTTTGDHFDLLIDGVGFGLITQPDIII